jgi:hypothetical protein
MISIITAVATTVPAEDYFLFKGLFEHNSMKRFPEFDLLLLNCPIFSIVNGRVRNRCKIDFKSGEAVDGF